MLVAATKSSNGSSWFRFSVPVLIFFCSCLMRFFRLLWGTTWTKSRRPSSPLWQAHWHHVAQEVINSPAESKVLFVAPENRRPSSDCSFGQHVMQNHHLDHEQKRQQLQGHSNTCIGTGWDINVTQMQPKLVKRGAPDLFHDLRPPQTRSDAAGRPRSLSGHGSGCLPSSGPSPSFHCCFEEVRKRTRTTS